jgi:hypothetical protein
MNSARTLHRPKLGQVRPPNGTLVEAKKPVWHGGNPYDETTCNMVLKMCLNGDDITAAWLIPHRHQHTFPSLTTCRRIWDRYLNNGHVLPRRATGNNFSTREVHGQDLINLALFRKVRPKAYIDEVRAYVHNRNPANVPYSHSQIVRAECRLGLFSKKASSTSDCAYTPLNLHKRERYWNGTAADGGVAGESTRDVIDLDEAQFKLETQDRKYGKVSRQSRCDAKGKYKKGAGSVSLVMAVSGDEVEPFSYHECYMEGGTDQWRFYTFMLGFVAWLAVNRPGRSYCFTMDNLNLHKHAMIITMIMNAGHRIAFRAPYWSCDGAIEYVFNTIQTSLQMETEGADDVFGLVNKLNNIIGAIPSFKRYFIHVGFPNN